MKGVKMKIYRKKPHRQNSSALFPIIDAIPNAVAVTDSIGKVIKTNALFNKLWGSTNLPESLEFIVAQGQCKDLKRKLEKNCRNERPPISLSLDTFGPDRNIPVDCNACCFHLHGIEYFMFQFNDLSLEQRISSNIARTHKRLQVLTEGVRDLIVEIAKDGSIVFANTSFLGMAPSDIIGKQITNILPDEVQRGWEQLFEHKVNSDFQFRSKPDKDKIPRIYSAKAVFVEHQYEIVHCVLTVSDVTESFKRTEELLKNRQELKLNIEAKDKFLSILGHDLKGPFNSLISFGQLLADTIDERDFKRATRLINLINESALLSYNLLENLLTWSRSLQGRIRILQTSFNIVEALSDTAGLLKASAISKNINIQIETNDPIIVYADYNMIKTVIRNLLANAIKYCNSGGSILLGYELAEGAVVTYIQDNGIGMPEYVSTELFGKQRPASRMGTRNEKGTGLGLLVCKEFVEANGGTIDVETEEGQGSRFYFSLPAAIKPTR